MSSSPQGWPAPQPPQPHPPVPPAYGAPQPPATTNGLAVASLVTGIVCLVPPLGLVLGALALPAIRRKGQRGKGLAVAGMALSLVSTLLVAAGFATGAFSELADGARKVKDEVASTDSAFSLRTGDCFDQPGGATAETEVMTVKDVDCAKPHDAEVTGAFQLTGDAYPGVPAIEKQAEERCLTIGERYSLDHWAVPENAVTFYYHPTEDSWKLQKDRTVTCAYAAEKGKLTGSLRADATTLDAHQLAYLTAVNAVEAVLLKEPEADPDADFDANTAWAGSVAKALDGAAGRLKGHTFPGASAAPVADVVTSLEKARGHWRKAADAVDADAFWTHYEPGYDALPLDLGKDARAALKLSTKAPEPEPAG
ncbi:MULTISPECIES: DUF4190 domain-containing protein [Streptomyces]|uniref:Septum formation-related domain-containing protein n=2 Tax=Streptomyces TaxID=1883 RepID=A0A1D8G5Y4_9ACTN|nr:MULTISPECIES: DUF4190 domain-containing protein [Streptomyces]AOT60848.1 hypothetical protein A4G23_03723 [Streptomyces rubrolavendulae]KAF0651516.1 hypothetical protein K701_03145 [Streptomyces fradiae ATCC 10745 = DSM 40063]OSY51737.1 hypothetical protein BG846_02669 [Streptomyces fradiae ATCC 10745 = DSM 40063]QEV13925.1 DUF4190 domain-containing protein [Streptomyces fradiae ATCC 10745 = DSM 40063]UQS30845.1 DUF4190 domain-containing protein [Streptomyces fradiae]